MTFHEKLEIILPTDFHSIIFQRGRAQPPTSKCHFARFFPVVPVEAILRHRWQVGHPTCVAVFNGDPEVVGGGASEKAGLSGSPPVMFVYIKPINTIGIQVSIGTRNHIPFLQLVVSYLKLFAATSQITEAPPKLGFVQGAPILS